MQIVEESILGVCSAVDRLVAPRDATPLPASIRVRTPSWSTPSTRRSRLVLVGFTGNRPVDKAWKIEVRKGRTPTPKAVWNRLFSMEGHRRRRRAHAKAAVLSAHLDFLMTANNYDRLGPQIAEWISNYLEDHETGPCWSEVGRLWGWDRIHTQAILKATHRAGWVTSSELPRSPRSSNPARVQAVCCLDPAQPRIELRSADDACL